MKYSHLLPVFIILFSCNNNHDVKNVVVVKNEVVKPKYTIEQQQKVFSNIHFGITKKQYEKLYNKFLKSKKCEFGCSFANFHYDSATPVFDNNSLYYVEFSHRIGNYDKYDTNIHSTVNDAYQAIKAEYGEPSIIKPIPNWSDVENLSSYLINHWSINDKVIEIQVNRINDSYNVSLIILKKSVNDLVDRKNEKADSVSNDSIVKSNKGVL